MKILVINPGSTSTKVALYENETALWTETIAYSKERLAPFSHVADQLEMRVSDVRNLLSQKGWSLLSSIDAVAARGGLVVPMSGGTYLLDDALLDALRNHPFSEHASNLGGLIAAELSKEAGVPAYITDPVTVDELLPEARLSGLKGIFRYPLWHALNQRAAVRRLARELGKNPEEINAIVCHMGGGVSVGAHEKGRTIDVNNSLDGEGPMSAERSGTMSNIALLQLMDEGLSPSEIRGTLVGRGGFVSHLGTNSLQEIERRMARGDDEAALVHRAFVYQCSKEIASLSAALRGKIDGIVVTGGMAHSDMVTDGIRERIEFLAPVFVYPGEMEMDALASGALSVLRGGEALRFNPNHQAV